MSAYLLGMAFKCDMETPTRKLVLLKQIDACEEDGTRIFPAMATVARAAQCSKRQVQREIAKFVEAGLLILVREGGSGPRSTNEYRLDLGVLKRISEVGWKEYVCGKNGGDGASREAGSEVRPDADASPPRSRAEGAGASANQSNKDDTESPLTDAEKGDTGDTKRVTLATDKGDSWSHTTPPDPSPDPSLSAQAREREGDAGEGENKPENPERGFKRFAPTFETWLSSSEKAAREAWFALTPAERLAAEDRAADYVAAVKAEGKQHICSLGVYLAEKRWTRLPEKTDAPPQPLELGPYGKGWMALRLWLLANLPRQKWRPTAIQQRLIDAGKGAQFETNRQQGEYPRVHALDIDATRGLGARFAPGAMKTGSGDGEAVFDACEAESYVRIRRGSAEWSAWEDWHSERGWPWIDPPAHVEWVWVPSDYPKTEATNHYREATA